MVSPGDPWLSPWPSPDPPAAQGRGPDPGLGPWHLHAAAASEAPRGRHPDPGHWGRAGRAEMGDVQQIHTDTTSTRLKINADYTHNTYICIIVYIHIII